MNNFVLRITEVHLERAIEARNLSVLDRPASYTCICVFGQAAKELVPEMIGTSWTAIMTGNGYTYRPKISNDVNKLMNFVLSFDEGNKKGYALTRSMLPLEIEFVKHGMFVAPNKD